jgi:GNAT superfamily N-acetyltransferase
VQVGARLRRDEDAEPLRALRALAGKELEVHRGGARLRADRSRSGPEELDRLEAVAEIDSVVVGYADARLVLEADSTRTCRLEAIYVEPGAREVGAGAELLKVVLEFAERSGATALDALVLPGQREAKNLFERAGFVSRLIVMQFRPGIAGHLSPSPVTDRGGEPQPSESPAL